MILLLIAAAISVGVWFYEREEALPYEGMVIFAIVLLNGSWATSRRPAPSDPSPLYARWPPRSARCSATAHPSAFRQPTWFPVTSS